MRHPLLIALTAASLTLACAHGPSRKERRAAEIHHDLGADALRAGRAQEALREFDEALRIDDGFAEAHLGKALVLELAYGKLSDAETEYRRALALRRDYPEAHNDLGQLLAKAGRYDEAVPEFDAAMADMMYREPYVARCNKGQALYRMGRRDDGIAEMKACLAAAPSYCQGRRELGRIYLDQGRVKDAVDELSAYAHSCEKVADAHWQLGLARMKAGDVPAARESLERCEKLGEGSAVGEECRRSLELLQ
jgi:Tfp pilus assembly protein PilF